MLSTEDVEFIKRRALEIAAAIDEQAGSHFAEYVPGVTPQWYVLKLMPGLENEAIDDLVRRRVGIYDPMFDEVYFIQRRWKKVRRIKRTRLLPGYLFVFVWDIDRHWSLLENTVGVSGIVKHAGTEHAFVVPEEFVMHLQRKELEQAFSILAPKAKRKKKRYAKDEPAVFHTKSYMHDIASLAAPERISLWQKAMGLAS